MEEKEIILCQGGKKELEEITGEKYEYLSTEKYAELRLKNTFFEIEAGRFRGDSTVLELQQNLSDIAKRIGADAVIHYTTMAYTAVKNSQIGGARGTPVKLKK